MKTNTLLTIIVVILLLTVVPFPLALLALLVWGLIRLPKSLANGAKKDAAMVKSVIKTAKQIKKDIK